MHYHAEIHFAVRPMDIDAAVAAVAAVMKPYSEHENPNGWWDWWQIGGRYTGCHDDYDPHQDPRNHEPCSICLGTGLRNDELGKSARTNEPSYTCNACGHYNPNERKWTFGKYGKGVHLKWPTNWAEYKGDIMGLPDVKEGLTAYTLLAAGKVLHLDEWNGKDWVPAELKDKTIKQALQSLGITSGTLITVDYHC